MQTPIHIREFEKADLPTCVALFKDTVHTINANDYNPNQLDVWAPQSLDHTDTRWHSLFENITLIAESEGVIVGFTDLTFNGYLDRLFVHKDYQRQGIASRLLKELENVAVKLGVKVITTEASITAKPFFTAHDYHVVQEQQKIMQGIELINFVMKKSLR